MLDILWKIININAILQLMLMGAALMGVDGETAIVFRYFLFAFSESQ